MYDSAKIDAAACAHEWDVLVIGAGPAGTLAAREAAQAGARTLLIDRKAFPRNKVCGACLNQSALSALNTVGLGERIRRLEGRPVTEFHVRTGGRGVSLSLPSGLAVARQRLDTALAAAAVDAGVQFLPETTATVGDIGGEGPCEFRSVTLTCGANHSVDVRAKLVLSADGLGHSSLDGHPEFTSRVAPGSRIGLGGFVTEFPPFYRSGTIFMAVGHRGYVGLVRTGDSELNVAAAIDPGFVRQSISPAAALAAILAEAGLPAVPTLDASTWQGTLPLTRRSLRLAGRRILLLGDAAGYVEPFTGEGMAWAFAAALQSAPFVRRGLQRWDPALEREWSRQLRRRVTNRQRWCRYLSLLLRHPRLSRAVLTAVSIAPRLAQPVIRGLNSSPPPLKGAAR